MRVHPQATRVTRRQRARRLGDLINDVLDLSQLEAGRPPLNRELQDLGETVRQAVDMVRGLAEARGLRLEVELPPYLSRLRLDRLSAQAIVQEEAPCS